MIKKSETITEYAKAFCKAQAEVKQPLKDADNPFFKSKYVPLENVSEAITKAFAKHDFSYQQDPTTNTEAGLVEVTTLVLHGSGEWMEFGPLSVKPTKNDVQGAGSAITYAKRYALSAIFGITSDQDDDGNEASKPVKKQQVTKPIAKKIDGALVTGYKSAIQNVIEKTGKNDGSIMRWFLELLQVAKIEDITTDKVDTANKLIEKLQGGK